MRNAISLLLGSGFSIPEQLPGVKQISQRLSKIDESEILIHSDQHAIFLNGQQDNNRFMNHYGRLFLQEFLRFYSSQVLKEGQEFHYETFYDYYSDFLRGEHKTDEIEVFVKKFNEEKVNEDFRKDARNWMQDFNRTFNQLLASLLQRSEYFEDITKMNYPPYDSFIHFLKQTAESHDIKVHSLNHDIFFEHIGRKHADLWQLFSDGYERAGSPFYGTVRFTFNHVPGKYVEKSYKVKLERFVNKYETPLTLFKLHGSICTHIVYPKNGPPVRVKRDYGIGDFSMEVYNEKKEIYESEWLWDEVAPDFLSGTTEKTRRYGDDFYKEQFTHFEKNLQSSELLIVIGYGFQDSGINEYLEKHYLSTGKRMIVIDPGNPTNPILDKYKWEHIQKSAVDVSYDELCKLIPGIK